VRTGRAIDLANAIDVPLDVVAVECADSVVDARTDRCGVVRHTPVTGLADDGGEQGGPKRYTAGP
jgi:hypothetical protein